MQDILNESENKSPVVSGAVLTVVITQMALTATLMRCTNNIRGHVVKYAIFIGLIFTFIFELNERLLRFHCDYLLTYLLGTVMVNDND